MQPLVPSDTSTPIPLTRRDKLLQHEVAACEDPICCCEPEPRWLRFQQLCTETPGPSEWEAIDRPPNSEL